jgi:AcrR family transcriptional regulator
LESTPKRTQRERLVDAMIELSAQAGYQSVSIAQVSSHAGVSSATFYEQFDGKEDCLLAAYRAARTRVFGHIQPVAASSGWLDAARVTISGLLDALQSDPDAGRLVFVEALAGGPRMREERERVLGGFEKRIQDFLDSTPEEGDTLDIPVAALEGARRSIVSRHLRTHSEDRLPLLVEDMLAWMGAYAIPAGGARWSTGPHALLPPAPAQEPAPALDDRGPARLPRGRHGLPAGVVARSQRGRIIHGTAEVMMSKGYANATVADIVAAAGISRDVFYEHFTSKQHAFMEAQQYATQHIFDTCAAAYFTAEDWPERVWNALRALIGLIASNPAISHLRVVECYAAGAAAIRSTDEILRAAAIFLEEGYSYRPESHGLPRLCSQAITGAIFEIVYRHVARGDAAALPRHLPQFTYIALAPFTGPEEAIRLVEALSAREVAAGGS